MDIQILKEKFPAPPEAGRLGLLFEKSAPTLAVLAGLSYAACLAWMLPFFVSGARALGSAVPVAESGPVLSGALVFFAALFSMCLAAKLACAHPAAFLNIAGYGLAPGLYLLSLASDGADRMLGAAGSWAALPLVPASASGAVIAACAARALWLCGRMISASRARRAHLRWKKANA